MATTRSDTAYGYWRESAEKFEYFVVGLTGALTAYVGEHLHPSRIGLTPDTVELLALVVLVVSVVLGLKRIETNLETYKAMHKRLYAEEGRGNMIDAARKGPAINTSTGDVFTPAQMLELAEIHRGNIRKASELFDSLANDGLTLYKWRNRCLLAGFALLIFSRVLPAYR